MGTYDDSKIRVSRADRTCAHCTGPIRKGDRYLSYKLGLRNVIAICMRDALGKRAETPGIPYRYNCKAVLDEARRREVQPFFGDRNG